MPEQEQLKQVQKRKPAVLTTIKELNKDMLRVSLVGTVVSRNSEIYSFLLDDGTGTINVIMNDIERFNEVKEGKILRVFGKVWGEDNEIEIQGDLIQDFSKIDMNLFKKVFYKQTSSEK